MKCIAWDPAKNEWLKAHRNVGFEAAVFNIHRGDVLDIIEHPDKGRYPGQRIFVIEINRYAYLVPFVESEQEIFLETIIPSRKATRLYLGGK